jgi:hypothetical protein
VRRAVGAGEPGQTSEVHAMSSTVTRLLLSLFFVFSLPGCEQDDDDGGGGAGLPDDGAGEPLPVGDVPRALVGDWRWGTVSLTTFWDGNIFQGGSGTAAIFRFRDDGSFEEYVYIRQQNYGCTTQVWTSMEGVVDFDDGVFRTHLRSGDYKASDTCVARFNFERPMTAEEVQRNEREYLWALEPEEKLRVFFGEEDAQGSTFERLAD